MTKLYVTGPYLIVNNGVEELTGLSKNVIIKKVRETADETYYSIINLPGMLPSNLVPLSKLTDEAGLPYTEATLWTFAIEQTGHSEIDVISQEDYRNLENVESKLYFTYGQ